MLLAVTAALLPDLMLAAGRAVLRRSRGRRNGLRTGIVSYRTDNAAAVIQLKTVVKTNSLGRNISC